MYEIRVHGRGGQGVKMTSKVLGTAAELSGLEAQDFAVYGAERRGAPVASFCRISKSPIMAKGYIFEPDAVIVLDPTVGAGGMLKGLKKGGTVLVNAAENIPGFDGAVFIDATAIALKEIGKPIPDTAIVGAFVKLTGIFPIETLLRAVRIELEEAGHSKEVEGNQKACRKCWDAATEGAKVKI